MKTFREPNRELIVEVVAFINAQNENYSGTNKIVNLISIYKCIFEMRSELFIRQAERADKVLDEIEKSFKFVMKYKTLPERRLSAKYIFVDDGFSMAKTNFLEPSCA